MKKCLLTLSLLILTVAFAIAQRSISGIVTDVTGEALIGANVVAKGTTVGTVTGLDGDFRLNVPDGTEAIVISYTGYTTQDIALGASNILNVSLVEGLTLESAIVTALGVSREKKSLGYAVQELSNDELNNVQQSDAISALAGKVSGVQIRQSSNIGGSKQILVRGSSSFLGDNSPLIVIDGLPVSNTSYNSKSTQQGNGGYDYGNMLNDLNMDDIESITILKGTGAAIYGSRAANGVINITTKKGNSGGSSFGINFSSSYSVENVSQLPTLQNKYGGGAIVSDADGGVDGFEVVNIGGTDYKVPQYGIDESWGPRYDESIEVLHWDAFSEDYPEDYLNPRSWVASPNDVEEYFDTGVNFVNSVSVHSSGDNYGIRLGYTNTDYSGVIPGSTMDKNSISLNSNLKIFDNLEVNSFVNYVRSETKGRPVLGYPASGQRFGGPLGQTLFQWTQRQIDYQRSRDYLNSDGSQRSWNRNSATDPTPHYSDNHYWSAYESFSDDERDRVVGNIGLNYELVEGLTIGGRASADFFTFYNRDRVAVGSQSTPSYYEAVRNNYEYNMESTLRYITDINSDLSMNAMVGGNQMRTRYHFNRGQSDGGLVVPGVYNLKNSVETPLTNDISEEKHVNSVFGQVGFGFKNMLYLDLTARNDWTSALPNDENSFFYPSVSASFVLSELLQDMPWLSYAKLRAGWAKVGKDTDPYRVLAIYDYNTEGPFGGSPRVYAPKDLLNANLKPEITTTYEVGVDLAFMNNRFGFDLTYFDNITNDQIMPLELSKASGYDSKFINAGEIQNKGIELGAFLTPVKTSDFNWTVNFNYTKVNNTVNEIVEGTDAIDLGTAPFSGVILRASVGDSYGQLWGTNYIFDDNGNKVVGANGYWLTTPSIEALGSVQPDLNMGISNSLSYKNLSFSFLFDIQKGGKFYSLSHMWGSYAGLWEHTAGVNDKGNEIRDAVLQITDADGNVTGYEDGTGGIKLDGVTGTVVFDENGNYTVTDSKANETYVSAQGWSARHYHGFGYPAAQSVFDASYIKLREMSLSYKFNLSKMNNVIDDVTITAFGKNLWVGGLAIDGLDPEATVSGSGNIQGIEGSYLPTTRMFGLKLQLGI